MSGYVHGYDQSENARLNDQAQTLAQLLHHDTLFAPGATVLEAGCGVGSQTVTIAAQNPGAAITSVDISAESVAQAERAAHAAGIGNVKFLQADIFSLPFAPQSFDHVFVCFVLEHLPAPVKALKILKGLLKPGGSLTVIEGDHGSAYFHPDGEAARKAIGCQIELQRRAGGNANIGRELYPLLREAGFGGVRVTPRMVYVDGSKPALIDGFTEKTFTAMIRGVREKALIAGLMGEEEFDRGIGELMRTATDDGVFCYTFFKATATGGS